MVTGASAVAKDAQYDLSVALRADDGFAGPVGAALVSTDLKTVYARAQIEQVDSQWKTYKLTLTSNAHRSQGPAGDWFLAAGHAVDGHGFAFPEEDLEGPAERHATGPGEMLENLHPSFVRFPGGCWVEGETLETAMRWKRTIGDLAQRRTQWNIWQYYATNGLGFHEYLQMCEDLGAEPLFVINCGMSHKEKRVCSRKTRRVRGIRARRAGCHRIRQRPGRQQVGRAAGESRPSGAVHLKYMEIGNENGGPAYHERYALFYDAIKAKYPQMNLIADEWQAATQIGRPVEIVDEHYYNTPEFFISNADKYDTYDRKGYKVYVGEYAVTQNCGRGNLRGAVGEAAFMTGMERNSDVVVMASYAPLFVNVNDRQLESGPDQLRQFPGLRHSVVLRATDVQPKSRRRDPAG